MPVAPNSTVSLPGPPSTVSLPSWPLTWSSPGPPPTMSLPSFPVTRSAPSPPPRRSLPGPPLSSSASAPPSRASLPRLPLSVSVPAPPASWSLPALPSRRSVPSPPLTTSAALPGPEPGEAVGAHAEVGGAAGRVAADGDPVVAAGGRDLVALEACRDLAGGHRGAVPDLEAAGPGRDAAAVGVDVVLDVVARVRVAAVVHVARQRHRVPGRVTGVDDGRPAA